MKSKDLRWSARGTAIGASLALPLLAIAVLALPRAYAGVQSRLPASFTGLLNDYTPAAPILPGGPGVAGGPYEMHGKWSLHLRDRGAATFTAEMTMETADFANATPADPTKLGPHTHHISVMDGMVHDEPTDSITWQTQCPTFKPPVTDGFVVTGTAYITGNGGNPPFGNPSPVTICILGGTQNPSVAGTQAFVEFSNFTLTFGKESRASTHFGPQAINGVVTHCEWGNQSKDCKVTIVD